MVLCVFAAVWHHASPASLREASTQAASAGYALLPAGAYSGSSNCGVELKLPPASLFARVTLEGEVAGGVVRTSVQCDGERVLLVVPAQTSSSPASFAIRNMRFEGGQTAGAITQSFVNSLMKQFEAIKDAQGEKQTHGVAELDEDAAAARQGERIKMPVCVYLFGYALMTKMFAYVSLVMTCCCCRWVC